MSARSIPLDTGTRAESPTGPSARPLTARPINASQKDISRFRSIVSAPLKGIGKGALNLARLGLTIASPSLLNPRSLESKFLHPLFEKAEQKIEQNIPTQEHALEKGLERTGRFFTETVPFGGGLGRAAIAGAAGQLAEQAGAGEVGQGISELVGGSLPGLGRKIIASSADQKKMLELGRRFGMTEEQLAPLMPGAGKKSFFGKFARGGTKATEAAEGAREKTGEIYNTLRANPSAQKILERPAAEEFIKESSEIAHEMPFNVRSQIAHDAADLVRDHVKHGGFRPRDLMNFYRDISSRYNLGRKQLELLKGPIHKAIHSIDPALAEDFNTTNNMYQKAMQIQKTLKPNKYEKLIVAGEIFQAAVAAATFNIPLLTTSLGVSAARNFADRILTSPRLQNILQKIQKAVVKNQTPAIEKLTYLLKDELEEDKK